MMNVYLDLDRTLFNTDLGVEIIWQEIATISPDVDASKQLASRSNFYSYNDDAYAYDLASHIESLGLDSGFIFKRLQNAEIADGRLEYGGVAALVDWIRASGGEVRVLTYGIDD